MPVNDTAQLRRRTGFGGGDCGYPFELQRSYRVHAFTVAVRPFPSGPPVAPVEFLFTDICRRTIESLSARVDDLPPARFRYTLP